jgi:hypothetical protein
MSPHCDGATAIPEANVLFTAVKNHVLTIAGAHVVALD